MVFEALIKKYIRPKSATFWIGMMPIIGGLIQIADYFVPMGTAYTVSYVVFGDTSPFILIMTGAGTITMRASIPPIGYMK